MEYKNVFEKRFFYSPHNSEPQFENLSYRLKEFEEGKRNRIRGHYCYQADSNLGVGMIAVRRGW